VVSVFKLDANVARNSARRPVATSSLATTKPRTALASASADFEEY
jgi:hypothetical protein